MIVPFRSGAERRSADERAPSRLSPSRGPWPSAKDAMWALSWGALATCGGGLAGLAVGAAAAPARPWSRSKPEASGWGAVPSAPSLLHRRELDENSATPEGLRLGAIFDDGMVLTAPEAMIYGLARPGQEVRIALDGQSAGHEVQADEGGRWEIGLPGLAPGGPHELAVEAEVTRHFQDVHFGQVYLTTGASNMHHPLAEIAYDRRWGDYEQRWRLLAREVIERGPNPMVRAVVVHKHASAHARPLHHKVRRWQVARPADLDLGALPYLFASKLQPRDGVPIGIVQSVAGGTPSAEWLRGHQNADRNYYNGMMAPLRGFNFTAVLLAQGESEHDYDADMSGYRDRLAAWMGQLREDAGYPSLPVIVLGSAGLGPKQEVPVEPHEGWRCLDLFNVREGQIAAVLRDPNAAYVVTSDIGDTIQVHYPNKWEAARRAIEAQRKIVHREGYCYLSPLLNSWEIVGRELVLGFAERSQPIAPGRREGCTGPIRERPFDEVLGLAVAGPDYLWRTANASFDGDRLHVWSDEVPGPVAARYAWARNPVGNLYTFPDGMPVAPWRTDNLTLTPPVNTSATCSRHRHGPVGFVRTGGDLCPI